MSNLKVIPKPKKKNYQYKDEWSELASIINGKNMVKIDKDGYIKHLEKYTIYLEKLIETLENKK